VPPDSLSVFPTAPAEASLLTAPQPDPQVLEFSARLTRRASAPTIRSNGLISLKAQIDAETAQAISLAQPLPAALLPLTPAQYNGGTAGPVLKKARATLVEARGLLQAARKYGQACRDALR